jgi:hypothetical protein
VSGQAPGSGNDSTPGQAALPKVHAHPDALFDAWWDETYEPDEGDPVGAPDRHVPRDAFHAGWDHARALLAPNGGQPQPGPELGALLAAKRAELWQAVPEAMAALSSPAPGQASAGQAAYEALETIVEFIEQAALGGTDADVAVAAGSALAVARHALAAREPDAAPAVTVEALAAALTGLPMTVRAGDGWEARVPAHPDLVAAQLLGEIANRHKAPPPGLAAEVERLSAENAALRDGAGDNLKLTRKVAEQHAEIGRLRKLVEDIRGRNAEAVLAEPGAPAPFLDIAWRPADERREKVTAAGAELARLREVLEEVGVMAANAPEDGDCFAVCEEIAMRIAAHGVPGTAPGAPA